MNRLENYREPIPVVPNPHVQKLKKRAAFKEGIIENENKCVNM
jgi:hypothetical protein